MRRTFMTAVLVAAFAMTVQAQGPGAQIPGQPDPFGRFLFPPELVMQHQGQIGLTDGQRATLQSAIQDAQGTVLKMQFALAAEAEKLTKLLEAPRLAEADVLSQVDRILMIEREVKRAQVTLMVRIKNTLTEEQQAKLRQLRG